MGKLILSQDETGRAQKDQQDKHCEQPGPCFYWTHTEFSYIKLSHEEAAGLDWALLLPRRICRITPTLNCPRGGVFDKERRWVGGEINHRHGDPNNAADLVNTAEAIVAHHQDAPTSQVPSLPNTKSGYKQQQQLLKLRLCFMNISWWFQGKHISDTRNK